MMWTIIFRLAILVSFAFFQCDCKVMNFNLLDKIRKPVVEAQVQKEAVENLIKRHLKNDWGKFEIIVDDFQKNEMDFFELKIINGDKVQIKASSGVAAASGFHYYLKYYCRAHISWDFNQLKLPETLPQVNETIKFNDKFRYYQNVCTTSYSFVWWNWTDWERHIDWMALNSFNLVLAFNGQEEIWDRVYQKLNMTKSEIDEQFSGPAFLSWNRMGNLRGWAGPLSSSWHQRSLILQKMISKRMRELGITPVLPAFAGIVPKAFKRLFPASKLFEMSRWNHFGDPYCCPYMLDPTDPVFKTVGNLFLQETIKEFGTNHVYNCDTFNENPPFTNDTNYLRQIGKSIFSAMTDVDKDAIWMLQGWMFYYEIDYWTAEKVEALLLSVPLGRMLVLDLQSEQFPQYTRLQNYFGQPYIWCMLHNFGGTLGMFGSAEIINNRVFEARMSEDSTFVGTGLTPEGINQNYVIYDLMAEMAWRGEPTNLTVWFREFSRRRYGIRDDGLEEAWDILRKTAYNYETLIEMRGKFAYNRRPSTKIKTWTWYEHKELSKAWKLFVDATSRRVELKGEQTFEHDLVDLTRQVLQNLADQLYGRMIDAFTNKNLQKFQNFSSLFLDIFDDAEKILATNEKFLLGNWIESAKRVADNSKDSILYEFNARNQITLWGPRGEIKDYANKQWSGIVSHFFKPRWSLFVRLMNDSLAQGTRFREGEAQELVFQQVEHPFTVDRTAFPQNPRGDTFEIAGEIYRKWRQFVEEDA